MTSAVGVVTIVCEAAAAAAAAAAPVTTAAKREELSFMGTPLVGLLH